MSESIKQCCYNCEYFRFGQLRKTFEGQELYHKGKCHAIDGENSNTISTAGQICELYKQAINATPALPEYFNK
jgi:hypothetical protein